jgi:hypothetical protein
MSSNNTDPSSPRSARLPSNNNNQNDDSWQHDLIQSPSDSSVLSHYGSSFDPPPPPSPARVYVSPRDFCRNRSDHKDSNLSCSKQQQQNYSSRSSCVAFAPMSLSSLAMPSLDFPSEESREPQEVSLRPRFSYITPPRSRTLCKREAYQCRTTPR